MDRSFDGDDLQLFQRWEAEQRRAAAPAQSPGWFGRCIQEQAILLGLAPLPKGATYEDFKRANRISTQHREPALAWTWTEQLACEPSAIERRRLAAGPWAFVLELEAEDDLSRLSQRPAPP